jgi:hypothetical protein
MFCSSALLYSPARERKAAVFLIRVVCYVKIVEQAALKRGVALDFKKQLLAASNILGIDAQAPVAANTYIYCTSLIEVLTILEVRLLV